MRSNTKQYLLLLFLLLSIFNIVFELIPAFPDLPYTVKAISESRLPFYTRLLDSGSAQYGSFEYNPGYLNRPTDFVNVFFYLLLLLGILFYWLSRAREMRLLRFMLAVVMVYAAFSLVANLTVVPYFLAGSNLPGSWGSWLLWVVRNTLIGFMAYQGIKWINADKTLQTTESTEETPEYVKASLGQRLTHLLVDTLTLSLITFPSALNFRLLMFHIWGLSPFESPLSRYLGFLPLIFIYYALSELLVQATPAKFLTETRTVAREGSRVSRSQILKRSLIRQIPLEPFFYSDPDGWWHDRWSGTEVVREKRTGVKGGRYLLLIPLFLIIGVAAAFYFEYADEQRRQRYWETSFYENKKSIEAALRELTTDHLLVVESKRGQSNTTYLKVEEVGAETVQFKKFQVKGYDKEPPQIMAYYDEHQDSFDTIWLEKDLLLEAYPKAYDTFRSVGEDLLGDGRAYQITRIVHTLKPIISQGGGGHYDYEQGEVTLNFCNSGWGGKVIAIENIRGNIEWVDPLPIDFGPALSGRDCPAISITGHNFPYNRSYLFRLVVEDVTGEKLLIEVEGVNLNRTLKVVDQ